VLCVAADTVLRIRLVSNVVKLLQLQTNSTESTCLHSFARWPTQRCFEHSGAAPITYPFAKRNIKMKMRVEYWWNDSCRGQPEQRKPRPNVILFSMHREVRGRVKGKGEGKPVESI
jgi:hypothetical protein